MIKTEQTITRASRSSYNRKWMTSDDRTISYSEHEQQKSKQTDLTTLTVLVKNMTTMTKQTAAIKHFKAISRVVVKP